MYWSRKLYLSSNTDPNSNTYAYADPNSNTWQPMLMSWMRSIFS
jgi:hypothetical protein